MSKANTNRRELTCSTCGQPFLFDETNSPPFCSERCKLIDLGRWLEEDISMPHEGGPRPGDIVEDQDLERRSTNSQS